MKQILIFTGLLLASYSVFGAPPSGPIVLSSVNDIIVTQDDVDRYIKFQVPPGRQSDVYRSAENIQQIVQSILITRILADKVKEHDSSQLDWQQAFQRESWLSELAQEQAIQEALSDIKWDAYAKETYIAEQHKFNIPARVDAAHILIKFSERSEADALSLILDLRSRLLAGEDFNQLALEYSEDPSAKKNKGELGAFSPGEMVKEFSDSAFAMKVPGSISEPVKTAFGIHLIKLNKILPAEIRPFESVKDQIIKTIRANIRAKVREQLFIDARSADGVKVNMDAIEAMLKK